MQELVVEESQQVETDATKEIETTDVNQNKKHQKNKKNKRHLMKKLKCQNQRELNQTKQLQILNR